MSTMSAAWSLTASLRPSPLADTARTALDDFALGLPLTTEGLVYAGIGLILGLIMLAGLERLLRGLFRRRRVV